MKNLEIECKFDANTPRAFARASRAVAALAEVQQTQLLHLQDTYLDHSNRDLAAQKIALRLRNSDGKWEATYKTRTEIKRGKAVRSEENLALPQARTFEQALKILAHKKLWNKLDVTHLIVQFSIHNKRRIYLLKYDGALLEVALDNVTIYVAGRRLCFKEIEIELKRGMVEALDKFAHAFSACTQLEYATISKVKTAEILLGLWKK